MPPNGKYHLSHFTCKSVRHTYGQRISVKKNSMEEGLMSIRRRGKYRNCRLYTFFNLYEYRLGIEPQIQLAKIFPYM